MGWCRDNRLLGPQILEARGGRTSVVIKQGRKNIRDSAGLETLEVPPLPPSTWSHVSETRMATAEGEGRRLFAMLHKISI
jgi:hypothetical protein